MAHPRSPKQQPEAIGVCYTPMTVVNYIVEQTVGRLVAGKTPAQVRNSLRVLDPACGEGVFLLGAYQYLLHWYRDRYLALADSHDLAAQTVPLQPTSDGTWQLTLAERWQVLRRHIYGVDISARAVQITQNLLLAQLFSAETPTDSAIAAVPDSQEPAFADLSHNLKWGNAIIDWDFPQQASKLEADSSVHPFNWQTEFSDVMQMGGFDAVIGNPPYVDSEWMAEHLPAWRHYCSQHYQTATGNWDLFCIFIEKAIALCRPQGFTSFVVPNKLTSAPYAAIARRLLTQQNRLLSLRDYSRIAVFPAAVYPIVYVAQKQAPIAPAQVQYECMSTAVNGAIACTASHTLDYQRYFSQPDKPWILSVSLRGAHLCDRLQTQFPTLASIATVLGAATVGEAYQIQPLIADVNVPDSTDLKLINSGTIDRYQALWGKKVLRYLGRSYQHPVIPAIACESLPQKRQQQALQPKIIVAGMTQMLECVLDIEGSFLAGKSTVILFTTCNPYYLLALLNSRLMTFYYRSLFGGDCLKGGYLRIGPQQLRSLPICPPPTTANARQSIQPLISSVQHMISLHKHLLHTKTAAQRQKLQHQIHSLDRKIDQYVCDLYNLSTADRQLIDEQALF